PAWGVNSSPLASLQRIRSSRTGAKRAAWPDAYPFTFDRKSARAVARSFIGPPSSRSPVREFIVWRIAARLTISDRNRGRSPSPSALRACRGGGLDLLDQLAQLLTDAGRWRNRMDFHNTEVGFNTKRVG